MFIVIMTYMLYNYFCLSKTFYSLPFTLRKGEGNGNPLQYSCLENPRDGGAWWAAVYVVTQSQTRLTRLSASGAGFMKNAIVGRVVVWILHLSFICSSSLNHSDWMMKNFILSIRKEEDWILPLRISQKFYYRWVGPVLPNSGFLTSFSGTQRQNTSRAK